MRNIAKGPEPKSLEEYRCQPDAYWDGYSDKKGAFAALCREQGYVCAYCMARIKPDDTPRKIEHWISQKPGSDSPYEPSEHEDRQLRWSNLLGVCSGGERAGARGGASESSPATKSHSSQKIRHCDTYRGNQPLAIHPALETRPLADLFKYRKDGVIYSDDPCATRDIKTLNLNARRPRLNRLGVLEAAQKARLKVV